VTADACGRAWRDVVAAAIESVPSLAGAGWVSHAGTVPLGVS
jgi:hypothetical protein